MAHNANARLEAFCDGVFAIAITLLILDMKVPSVESIHSNGDLWRSLAHLWPSFFALCLSFIIILISWIGHHNLLKTLDKTSAQFQFANGFFLLTVIFIPFPTALMSEYLTTSYTQPAIVTYCLSMLFHNIAWNLLYIYILRPIPLVDEQSRIEYIRQNSKGAKLGFVINTVICLIALVFPYVALALSVVIWIYWLIVSVSIKRVEN